MVGLNALGAENESLLGRAMVGVDLDAQESRDGEPSDAFMKEDLFSSSSDHLISVADEKQLSIENLNS